MADDQPMPKLLPVADEMTPAEREAYEREVLAELEKEIEAKRSSPYHDHLVRDVRLMGSYPHTEIFIRWFDTRDNMEKEFTYPLWVVPATGRPSFEYGPGGRIVGREPPSQVAGLIYMYFDE